MMTLPRIIRTTRVFETATEPRLVVDRHAVELPSGATDEWHSVSAQDGVAGVVCVVVREDRLLVGQHWRLAANGTELEFPRGFGERGETPIVTARRELLEETGMTARQATLVGSFYADSGLLRDMVAVVELRGILNLPAASRDNEMADLQWRSPDELDRLTGQGVLRDGITICALAIWRSRSREHDRLTRSC